MNWEQDSSKVLQYMLKLKKKNKMVDRVDKLNLLNFAKAIRGSADLMAKEARRMLNE